MATKIAFISARWLGNFAFMSSAIQYWWYVIPIAFTSFYIRKHIWNSLIKPNATFMHCSFIDCIAHSQLPLLTIVTSPLVTTSLYLMSHVHPNVKFESQVLNLNLWGAIATPYAKHHKYNLPSWKSKIGGSYLLTRFAYMLYKSPTLMKVKKSETKVSLS